MSSVSTVTDCPNCGSEAHLYEENRPYPLSETTCYECGFYTHTICSQMSLEELNEYRVDNDMPKLKELPECDLL